MSKTYRKSRLTYHGNKTYRAFLRKPKTLNEMRQNNAIIHDINTDDFEYKISGHNRIVRRKKLPTIRHDIHISGNHEDYQNKHRYD
jgi:hypothetical protein